ncbi:hypothetical protein [Tolypothrix sp. PCC 7601]|uniref:hypothetical protein n=1 Tax=Tolypothrix sp. PCC 7601 TaxID=1188 RepID=UPI0021E01440|nr:hypothetical protein [Tolypothrix sp. PCC 7601]UYD38985.1 hypothetical protein HG267_41440 [Tolypothrix sp. PCC 7601]
MPLYPAATPANNNVSRSSESITVSAPLANNSYQLIDVVLAKSFLLLAINCPIAARIRLYFDNVSRASDLSRVIGSDADSSIAIIAEVITSASLQTINLAPCASGFNANTTNPYYLSFTNLSGSAINSDIDFNLTYLILES